MKVGKALSGRGDGVEGLASIALRRWQAKPGRRPRRGHRRAPQACVGQEAVQDRSPSIPLAFAAVAHELRTPLQALAIVSESLVEEEQPFGRRRQDRLIRIVRHDIAWLQCMIENLLCSAALEAGQLRLRRSWISMHDVIADALPVLMPLLERRRHPPLRVPRKQMPLIWGDTRRLAQVVINLVGNASKYSDEGSPIEVRLDSVRGMVRLQVMDRGPGIGEQSAHRLFDAFYRLPEHELQGSPGAGLGLAITRAIVTAHGGRAGARNRRGGGACFWIELPAWPDHEQ